MILRPQQRLALTATLFGSASVSVYRMPYDWQFVTEQDAARCERYFVALCFKAAQELAIDEQQQELMARTQVVLQTVRAAVRMRRLSQEPTTPST